MGSRSTTKTWPVSSKPHDRASSTVGYDCEWMVAKKEQWGKQLIFARADPDAFAVMMQHPTGAAQSALTTKQVCCSKHFAAVTIRR